MSVDRVVLDTSVWIDALRGGKTAPAVREIVSDLRAILLAPVVEELLVGARPGADSRALSEIISLTPIDVPGRDDYMGAGELGARLRRSGVSVGAIDLLIAQQALRLERPLWTLDAHFGAIAKHSRLRLYREKARAR